MLVVRELPKSKAVKASRPVVICLHSSVSSGKQWQDLEGLLENRFRVTAVDLVGYGKAAEWEEARKLTLEDEVERLAPVVEGVEGVVHLVGHSYGGAVAARAALRFGPRVGSVTLFEPVLFRLLEGDRDSTEARQEIQQVERRVRGMVEEGRMDEAAEQFIDYWSGPGVWKGLPEWRQAGLARKMKKVVSDFDAVLGSDYSIDRFRRFPFPTLLLYGLRSPQSSRRVVERLAGVLPQVELRGLLGLGHMGPVSHPAQVNALIARYLDNMAARLAEQGTGRQRVA